MRVTGPAWPSTQALKEALADIRSEKVVNWGAGGKNGLQQLQAFKTAGVSCPEFTTDLEQAKKWVREGSLVFGRKVHHMAGNDIVGPGYKAQRVGAERQRVLKWITTRKGNRVQRMVEVGGQGVVPEYFNPEWLHRQFWVKVIKVKDEYRQHIAFEKAIRRGKKIQAEAARRVMPVRSRNNGWHIDYGEFNAPASLRDIAKKAVKALGYQWGAVDIIEDEQGKLYVLEVNSAPALKDQGTLTAYVEAFKNWVRV